MCANAVCAFSTIRHFQFMVKRENVYNTPWMLLKLLLYYFVGACICVIMDVFGVVVTKCVYLRALFKTYTH